MSLVTRQPPELPVPANPVSWVVEHGDLVFLAGQMPIDASGALIDGDFHAQAERVFDNLSHCPP